MPLDVSRGWLILSDGKSFLDDISLIQKPKIITRSNKLDKRSKHRL